MPETMALNTVNMEGIDPTLSVKTRGMSVVSDLERDDTEDEAVKEWPEQSFKPTQCLFCNQITSELDLNLSHMLKEHGFFIPENNLPVEVESLLSYCHLVIFGYFDCLYCGTQKQNVQAVQQHMRDKGHCKIDIVEGSEFYDFFSRDTGDEESEDETANPRELSTSTFVQLDETTLRLPSGKLLNHRLLGKPRPRRSGTPNRHIPELQSHMSDIPPSYSALGPMNSSETSTSHTLTTRAERRAAAFTGQLVHLRETDRRTLLHLPDSQRRTLLVTQKKQMDQARKAQKRMHGRVESMSNRTLMKHFVMDVPGPPNG